MADLVENATHGEGGGHPERDRIPPEVEADRSGATYGEPDESQPNDGARASIVVAPVPEFVCSSIDERRYRRLLRL